MITNETQDQQPDALTRLEQTINAHGGARIRALTNAILSEARKEMEALRNERNGLAESRRRLMEVVQSAEDHRRALQDRINALSAKASKALRMGQQQGQVELAQDLLNGDEEQWREYLHRIVSEDEK